MPRPLPISFRDHYCAGAVCCLRSRLVSFRGEQMTQTEFQNILAAIVRLAL